MGVRAYEIVFKRSAVKELQSLPQKAQQKILDAVQLIPLNPYTEPLTDNKPGSTTLPKAKLDA